MVIQREIPWRTDSHATSSRRCDMINQNERTEYMSSAQLRVNSWSHSVISDEYFRNPYFHAVETSYSRHMNQFLVVLS